MVSFLIVITSFLNQSQNCYPDFQNQVVSQSVLSIVCWEKEITPSTGAPVNLDAVLEYLAAEVLELVGNAARENK